MHRRSSVRDAGRRPSPALPPVPPYDIQATHSVVSIEGDPSRPSGRMVFLDGHESSYVDLADPTHLEFSYVRRIGDVIDLIRPPRQPLDVLHVGGGGFTLPRYVAATRPRSRQVVYEYDGELVRVAREHLGLAAQPGMRVRVGDARARLAERPDASADVVVGDAFSGVVVPAHLATVEFAHEVRRVLRPDGIYLLNVIDCPPLRVSRAEAATLLAAFGHVALVAERDLLRERDAGNVVFLASDAPLPLAEVRRAAARGAFPDDVLDRAAVTTFAGSAVVATDATTERWARLAPPPDLPVPLHGE
ncbi:MAG: Spermidine synthase [uncultured Corynebacteriales bacterium]|uniref:Spermidine synthase n=1 Tax=uncultured Mycobacteriales bacterium TaxID=581187 RepID=A0A6J4IVH9_9ACTN|nr:MAG: Spermidine synthase [uncultured Corynebacteriales bacterium]